MLRIGVLGRLALERDGQAISPPVGRPARSLLGWLALHPGTHSRSTVAATLWPDVLDESARGSLRVALVDLRRALGDDAGDALRATREEIGLIDSPGLEIDARAFGALMAAGEADRALALWRGELLEGLDAGDWLATLRDEYRDERSRALQELADRAAARGDHEAALRRARERVTLDPFSEDAARELMRRLASAGDRAAALRAYDRLAERLRTELRTAPSLVTRELEGAVRSGDLDAIEAAPASAGPGSRDPEAAFGLSAARVGFVGRRDELERLLDYVRAKRPLVMVTGEAGAGKTRLTFELAGAVRPDRTAVLFGRCHPEPLSSYEPFVEAIRAHVARAGAAAVAAVAGDELARLLPELRVGAPEQPPGDVAQAALLRLFEGVRATLGQAAGRRQLVLVLDDLHWADRSTVQLLAHLARVRTGPPITIVGTFRTEDVPPTHPLRLALADLERGRPVPTVGLRGLDATATASMLAEITGMRPEPSLLEDVLRQTGGNPFFVEQLARHLSETGRLSDHDGYAALSAPVDEQAPAGIRALVRSRVARLPDAAGRALALAAIAGAEFSLARLQDTGELEATELLDGLEAAETAGLITPSRPRPGRWTFRHALVRSALYEELSELRRARLHSRFADVLEKAESADPTELAQHAFAARAVDGPERAIRTSTAAAEHALTALAYEEAAEQYQRALSALDDGDARDRVELLLALGEAQTRAADPQAQRTFLTADEEARGLGDPELAARAALGRCGVGVTIVGLDEERANTLERAVEALGDRAPALKARLLARLAIELYYAPGRHRAGPLAAQAVELARAADDPDALLAALSARHVARWTPDGLGDRLAVAGEMISLAHTHHREEQELQGHNWLCADLWEAGHIDRFEDEIAEHARLAARLRLPTYRWYGPLWRASLAALRGQWAQAEQLLVEAEEAGIGAGDRNATLFASGVRLEMRLARMEFAAEDLALAEHHVRQSPAGSAWRCLRCWFAAQTGDPVQARADLDWLAHEHFARLPRDANWLPALFELTEAVCLLGDRARAAEMYAMIAPFAGHHICAMRGAVSWGSAHATLGRLGATAGELDQAARHFDEALELERRWGARAWLVRTRVRYAELLIARDEEGDRQRATDLAREAIAQAHRLAFDPGAIPELVRRAANSLIDSRH